MRVACLWLVRIAKCREQRGSSLCCKLTRYALLNRKLLPYQPEAQEGSDLKSLLNRLDTLERDLRRERNRQEKISISSTLHRLEKQSMRRTVKHLETEIKRFNKHISQTIESNSRLQRDYELPGLFLTRNRPFTQHTLQISL